VSERWRKRGGRGGGRGEGTGCERLIGNNGQVERVCVCVCGWCSSLWWVRGRLMGRKVWSGGGKEGSVEWREGRKVMNEMVSD